MRALFGFPDSEAHQAGEGTKPSETEFLRVLDDIYVGSVASTENNYRYNHNH